MTHSSKNEVLITSINIFSVSFPKILYGANSTYTGIQIKIDRHSSIWPYANMGQKTLHPTYCHCKNPHSITATMDLHIIQWTFTSMTNPSKQIKVEITNSKTIKALWQIHVASSNYKNKINEINKMN